MKAECNSPLGKFIWATRVPGFYHQKIISYLDGYKITNTSIVCTDK